MTVYLGDTGIVELKRTALYPIAALLASGDVDADAKRFSFDFPTGALITGDRINIGTQDGTDLELVDGRNYPDGRWYCHVDKVGGVRLYDAFQDAVNGYKDNAVELVAPSKDQRIYVINRDDDYNCVGQISQYEITTSRETVDLTTLGDNFRESYANGLISGQGNISCFWEYKYRNCDESVGEHTELAQYFAHLVLRLDQGSSFLGRFYIHRGEGEAVWYEAECIVTNVGFSFEPGVPVRTRIDFVTTGPIQLIIGTPPSYLLKEDEFNLLQENGSLIELEDDEA